MRETFRQDLHMSFKNKNMLQVINRIIEEYRREGYVLTLRQLYYQLVSRDIIPNKQSEYAKSMSKAINKARDYAIRRKIKKSDFDKINVSIWEFKE